MTCDPGPPTGPGPRDRISAAPVQTPYFAAARAMSGMPARATAMHTGSWAGSMFAAGRSAFTPHTLKRRKDRGPAVLPSSPILRFAEVHGGPAWAVGGADPACRGRALRGNPPPARRSVPRVRHDPSVAGASAPGMAAPPGPEAYLRGISIPWVCPMISPAGAGLATGDAVSAARRSRASPAIAAGWSLERGRGVSSRGPSTAAGNPGMRPGRPRDPPSGPGRCALPPARARRGRT